MHLFSSDVAIMQTSGGGGRGDPWGRDSRISKIVAKEVRKDLISGARAERENRELGKNPDAILKRP